MKAARSDYIEGILRNITQPNFPVEVSWNKAKTVLWINIGPACVMRICRIKELIIQQEADLEEVCK